jgi:chromosome segregation ATPase
VLADARIRVEYLQAALAAAEAECSRLTGEAAGVRDKHRAETIALTTQLNEMTARARNAEKLVAETRERLLARIIEIDAVRQRAADANAASSEAHTRRRQLEDALSLQQSQFEELERSQSKLAEATKVLLQRFRARDRALVVAEEKIKALAERNARLEAGVDRAGGEHQRGSSDAPRPNVVDGVDTARQDWAELAQLLSDFVERKTSVSRAV